MIFNQVLREVLDTCLKLADKGYLAGTGGNVACRIDDEHFAITPSAIDYHSMNADDVCVLRLDNLTQIAGERRPSVEHRLHAHVLRARRDCQASIHTHQPIASAYTLLREDLVIVHPDHKAMLGNRAVCVDYAPSGTAWLASKLRKALRQDANAYLLRNHGVVCCGPTLAETARRLEALEIACNHFFRSTITKRMRSSHDEYLSETLSLLTTSEEMESPR